MQRFALFVLICVLFVGCGEKQNQETPTRGRRVSPPNATPIPRLSEGPSVSPIEGVTIEPAFDEAGEVSELAVAPGEMFAIYVVGFNRHEPTTAAQYRMVLPEGVRVLGEEHMARKRVTLGKWDGNFMIAYNCIDAEKPFWISRYNCLAEESFSGGTVETAIGVPREGKAFLGFSTCEHREMAASGGTAQLKRK